MVPLEPLEPLCPPVAPALPPEDEDELEEEEEEEPGEGIDEEEPPEFPLDPGEGRLEELPPERPDEPLDPEEPPEGEGGDEVGEGMDVEDWLAQPPIRKADTAPAAATRPAITAQRFSGCCFFIASPSIPSARSMHRFGNLPIRRLKYSATTQLNTR